MEIDDKLGQRLIELGIIPDPNHFNDIRKNNVGESDYHERLIQPWAIWMDWKLDPWEADIIKRIGRNKSTEDYFVRFKKIIHICEEKLRQLNTKTNSIVEDVIFED